MKKSRSKEEGNAMPSVRSRIKQFESLTSEENKANEEPSNNNNNKVKPTKKFLYPGHCTQLDQRQSPIDHVITSQSAGRQSGEHHNGMSNKLEEVWSVRRNIGVGRNVNSTISQLTTNMYSRHGALPAGGHPYLPPVISKKDTAELTSFGRSRSPLQDHNQDAGRLRNIRAGGYSYSEAKISHDLHPNMDISSSASKHKSIGIAAMIRPSDNGLLPPVNHKNDKKRRYAEKMAKAHLRSTGMGEYTPKSTLTRIQSSSTGDDEAGPSSRWKTRSNSDDDFDF